VAGRWIEDNNTSQWKGTRSNLGSMTVPSDDKCDEKCRSFDYIGRCWGNTFPFGQRSLTTSPYPPVSHVPASVIPRCETSVYALVTVCTTYLNINEFCTLYTAHLQVLL